MMKKTNGRPFALGLTALLGLLLGLSGCNPERPAARVADAATTDAATTDAQEAAPAPAPTPELEGTQWLLEDLAGAGVLDRAQATLSFGEAGSVHGNGSCNRFMGPVTIKDDSISFGALAATRMACPEAVMNQEDRYFAALGGAHRFELDGPFLYVYVDEQAAPLRFIAVDPAEGS
jgi:heat shock protein HslJ